jgi:hypothetical protein
VFFARSDNAFADVLRKPRRERAGWLNSVASEAQTMNDVSITDADRGDTPLGSLRHLLGGDAEATPRLSLTFYVAD